jgi:hypothetical protein
MSSPASAAIAGSSHWKFFMIITDNIVAGATMESKKRGFLNRIFLRKYVF